MGVLRLLAVLAFAFGFEAVAFFAVGAFLDAPAFDPFGAAAFFLGAAVLAVADFCSSRLAYQAVDDEAGLTLLAAGLAAALDSFFGAPSFLGAASFFASFTVPDGPGI